MEPIFICAIVFGAIVAVIIGPSYLKSRERMRMQQNLSLAIEKGQPLPPEVIEAISRASPETLPIRTRDIRRAVILIALSAAFITIGLISQSFSTHEDANFPAVLWSIATIPGFIGLAFLALALTNKNKN